MLMLLMAELCVGVFRDKKLSSDVYEKTDDGDDEQVDAVAAAADVQSSSDLDDLPARNPVMFQDVQATDVNAVQPGTRLVSLDVHVHLSLDAV